MYNVSKVIRLRKQNPYLTLPEIAKRTDNSPGSVRYILLKHELPTAYVNKKVIDTMMLRADNPCMSLQKIADAVGYSSASATGKILKDSGLSSKSLCATKFKVIKLRKENPSMSTRAIAKQIGCGHARVSQILIEAGLPTEHIIQYKYHCSQCGIHINKNKSGLCKKCRYSSTHKTVTCDYCGNIITRKRSYIEKHLKYKTYKGHFFCDRKCLGNWNKKHSILVTNPEIRHSTLGRTKLSKSQINQLIQDKNNGMNFKDLMLKYKISDGTVYRYLKLFNQGGKDD